MAWKWRLNLEPVVLNCAKEHISQMTNSNYLKDSSEKLPLPDESVFVSNFEHGTIAVILLNTYLESCANTVLLQRYDAILDGDESRERLKEKIERLFGNKQGQLRQIKGSVIWYDVCRIVKVRNSLIHYKNDLSTLYSSYPPLSTWEIGGENVGVFFTKDTLERCISSVEELIVQLLQVNDLTLNSYARTIGSNGSLGGMTYICGAEEYRRIEREMSGMNANSSALSS